MPSILPSEVGWTIAAMCRAVSVWRAGPLKPESAPKDLVLPVRQPLLESLVTTELAIPQGGGNNCDGRGQNVPCAATFRPTMARRMAQNGAPTHEIEREGRWKQDGGIVGRYTRGESAGSALGYL